jgi:hypothetical protein
MEAFTITTIIVLALALTLLAIFIRIMRRAAAHGMVKHGNW